MHKTSGFRPISYKFRRFVGFVLRALPAEQCPERLSVARAHGVVDHKVEGSVDVGDDDEHPETRHEKVVITSSCAHLWHEGQDEPAGHTRETSKSCCGKDTIKHYCFYFKFGFCLHARP